MQKLKILVLILILNYRKHHEEMQGLDESIRGCLAFGWMAFLPSIHANNADIKGFTWHRDFDCGGRSFVAASLLPFGPASFEPVVDAGCC